MELCNLHDDNSINVSSMKLIDIVTLTISFINIKLQNITTHWNKLVCEEEF